MPNTSGRLIPGRESILVLPVMLPPAEDGVTIHIVPGAVFFRMLATYFRVSLFVRFGQDL